MKAVESEGTSVQEAVNRALLLLGLDSEQVEITVLRDPETNGGADTAIVRVQPKASPEAGVPVVPIETKASVKSVPRETVEGSHEPEPEPAPERPRRKTTATTDSKPKPPTRRVSGETADRRAREDVLDDDVPLTDEEGERADKAGDFLEDLFELLDFDCYVEVAADRVEGRILVDIAGPDTAEIIGKKGLMLDAVELLLNRAMDNGDGGGTRIALDAEGYRERRTEKLRAIAAQQARKVGETGRPVPLEPMNARERRIVHMALKTDTSVQTRSEGEGPDRHIIIEPIQERARR